MKKLPETTIDWRALSELIECGQRHRVFVAALRLRIFDALDGQSASEIAAAMLRAGFQTVQSFTKQSAIGEMAVDIGRKARKSA